jgi:hypothetical protein
MSFRLLFQAGYQRGRIARDELHAVALARRQRP